MFENMASFVGFAMHDDLMMRTKRDARVAEAMRELARQATPRRTHREAVAQALVLLATRIAPSAAVPTTGPHLLAQ
jgi:hypothetical protein